jgi:hypothetical protein
VGKRAGDRLFDGKVSAGAVDESAGGRIFDKFETVAKGNALAGQSKDFDFPIREREFQAHDFVQSDFIAEHGGNARLADIDRMSANHRPVADVDADPDFQFETGRSAGFDQF